MGFPRLDEGQTRFRLYHSGFREASRRAHEIWKTKMRHLYADCPLRVVRGNVTQLLVQEARTLIGGMKGVRFIDTNSLQTLAILDPPTSGDRPWVTRFKHVDADFRARNIKTDVQKAFDRQDDFPGVPSGSIYFTLAYQMPGPDADLTGPFIMLTLSGKLLWRYNVNDPNSGTELRYLLDDGRVPMPIRRVRPAPGALPKRQMNQDNVG